jgi:tRNA A-37 threonylcarbamoyl transferase component Bud32
MMFNRAQVDSLLLQLQDASDELRRRVLARQPCRAEELFHLYPRLRDDPELAVRLVHAEWAARLELGEDPAVAPWLERFPQWRPLLERRFRADSFLDADLPEDTPTVFLDREGEDVLGATQPATHAGGDFPPGEAPPPLEIHEEIGRGAMGVVYRAWDKVLDRAVALKKIRAGLLDNPEAVRRFYHEARAAARLNHPHIIAVHGMGTFDGQHGFTMPLARANLDEHRGRFTQPRDAAVLVAKVARAVHAAHRHDIVHRDLKPANILLDDRGEPLVADFGLAVLLSEIEAPGEGREIAGTPHYMAPEQFGAFGARVSGATDIWALGVILYELLAGARPFTAKSMSQLQVAVCQAEPPMISKSRGIDRGLEAIVRRCLAKHPRDRYASAEELAQDLDDWRDGKPIKAKPDGRLRRAWRAVRRRPALATAAALLTLFGIVGGLLYAFAPAPVSAPPEDPDAVLLRSVYARLKNGETVEFVTPEGKLLRGRWVLEDGGVVPNKEKDGVDVHSLRLPGLLELLPDVPLERYELSVEVRQSPEVVGQPGIYGLHHAAPIRGTVAHSFLSLGFSEDVPWAGRVMPEFQYQDEQPYARDGPAPGFFKPKRGQWHALALRVTPAEVELLHNGLAIYKATADEITARAAGIRLGRQRNGGAPAEPAFDHNGGVGLYLFHGQATYRSITLKPLP